MEIKVVLEMDKYDSMRIVEELERKKLDNSPGLQKLLETLKRTYNKW